MRGCLPANWFHNFFFSFRKTIADLNDKTRKILISEGERDKQRMSLFRSLFSSIWKVTWKIWLFSPWIRIALETLSTIIFSKIGKYQYIFSPIWMHFLNFLTINLSFSATYHWFLVTITSYQNMCSIIVYFTRKKNEKIGRELQNLCGKSRNIPRVAAVWRQNSAAKDKWLPDAWVVFPGR